MWHSGWRRALRRTSRKIRTAPPLHPTQSEGGGEERRQHLEFIQSAITRMSSASAVAKGWALTIATATYGYAGTQASVIVAALGIVAVFLFFTIDVHYLKEERKYRLLFDAARRGEVGVYEMNATRYCNSLPRFQRRPLHWGRVAGSWSVRNYYTVMLAVGLVLIWWLQSR